MPSTIAPYYDTQLILSLTGIAISLDRFVNTDYPRIEAQSGTPINYTANGSIVYSGKLYESKFLWNVQAFLTATQEEYLDFLWAESDRLNRASEDGSINLHDKTRPYREKAPRSRDLASGATATTVTFGSDSYVSYFARFKAFFQERPVYSRNGIDRVATFTLLEGDRTVP